MTDISPTGISLDDRGFTLGHGLFETVLWARGAFAHWDTHVERLERGCRALGLPAPDRARLREAADAAIAAAGKPARGALRLNWSGGPGERGLDPPAHPQPRLSAHAAALGPPAGPARLITARVRRNDRSPAARIKSLSYLDNVLARAEARSAGGDEALMLNTAGEIACAAAANVFWVRHGEVFTPSLDCGVLDGVIRREVLAACHRLGIPSHEVFATPGRLALAAPPMFITNSLSGVRPVESLDGRTLPASPLIAALARAVEQAS